MSQHLKALREANVVTMEKQAQQRIYRLNPVAISEVEEWAKQYRLMWSFADRDGMLQSGMEGGMNEGFARLNELLKKRQA